jgi:hypothetical protein
MAKYIRERSAFMKHIAGIISVNLLLIFLSSAATVAQVDLSKSAPQSAAEKREAASELNQSPPTCYDWSNREIPCRFSGVYGELIYGRSSPKRRFVDNVDGTVTDRLTGLIWLKNAGCFGRMAWGAAIATINKLKSGDCGPEPALMLTDGSSAGDWRLPSMNELCSLIDFGRRAPALPGDHPFFNVADGYYWSSTRMDDYPSVVWVMYPESGTTCYDTAHHSAGFVWAVRDSKDQR